MNYCGGCDNEREKEVECKESGKGCIIYRKATSDSLDEGAPNVGDCGKEVGNDGCTSKGHLSSRKYVTNESRHHYKK